jgi:26S proteasome regulatory subunit N13
MLFGSPAATPQYHLEFKAGRLTQSGTRVTADPRKGVVQVSTSPEGILQVQHRERVSGNLIDEALLFEGSATFERVPQCTTGRVYVLKFVGSSRRMFFWIQEPSEAKDAENCAKLNELIANPPPPGARPGAGGPRGGGGGGSPGDMQNLLNSFMGRQGRPGAASSPAATPVSSSAPAAAPAAPARAPAAAPIAATPNPSAAAAAASAGSASAAPLLQPNFLAGLLGTPAGAAGTGGISLGDVLTPAGVAPVFDHPEVVEALMPLLPEGQRTPHAARELLRTPQFQQACARLTQAVRQGDAASILANFGIVTTGDVAIRNIEQFLAAIQRHHQPGGGN